jgi:hypothetical protein
MLHTAAQAADATQRFDIASVRGVGVAVQHDRRRTGIINSVQIPRPVFVVTSQ